MNKNRFILAAIIALVSGSALGSTIGFPPGLLPANNLNDVANKVTSINNILPSQTGNSGKVLGTNGSAASWVSGGSSGGTPGGTSGQVQYNNAGAFGGFTVGGDCTAVTSTGNYTCTKTNGASFAASATTDTTVATNITSGTLPAARLPVPTASTLGGVESLSAVSHNFLTSISTLGVPTQAQPAFSDLTGSVTAAQMPALTGDVTSTAGTVATTVAKIAGTAVSGTSGSVNVAFTTSPTFTTPILGAASATSVTFTSTSGIIGTTTNNNAAAGSVGEVLSNSASTVSINTSTDTNVVTLSLTAGDWDVCGNMQSHPAGTTSVSLYEVGSNTTTGTMPSFPDPSLNQSQTTYAAGVGQYFLVGCKRYSLATTTNVFLITHINFGVSTMTADGFLWARRAR